MVEVVENSAQTSEHLDEHSLYICLLGRVSQSKREIDTKPPPNVCGNPCDVITAHARARAGRTTAFADNINSRFMLKKCSHCTLTTVLVFSKATLPVLRDMAGV